jgi:hypothetical protein
MTKPAQAPAFFISPHDLKTNLHSPSSPQAKTLGQFPGNDGNDHFVSAGLDSGLAAYCSRNDLWTFPFKTFRALIFISIPQRIRGKSGPISHALRRKKAKSLVLIHFCNRFVTRLCYIVGAGGANLPAGKIWLFHNPITTRS